MLYGSELWHISKTELLFLERVHRNILRTIQGLPTRCPSSSLTALLGIQSIEMLIKQRSLGFIVATANLPPESVSRRVLAARAASNNAKGVVMRYHQELLTKHSLPYLSTLLRNTPSSRVWKTHVRKFLALRVYLDFLEECDTYHLSSCSRQLLKPVPHLAVTVGDVNLTRKNNFRIRLLVGCDGLEKDAFRFRTRNTGRMAQNPSCKLCGAESEDAAHFIVHCCALARVCACVRACVQRYLWQLLPLLLPCFLTPPQVRWSLRRLCWVRTGLITRNCNHSV